MGSSLCKLHNSFLFDEHYDVFIELLSNMDSLFSDEHVGWFNMELLLLSLSLTEIP